MELDKMTRMMESFSKEEHVQLLKIILEKDAAAVNENSNGTFVQMDDLCEVTLEKLHKYIDYILLKECDIQRVEETKEKLKHNINE